MRPQQHPCISVFVLALLDVAAGYIYGLSRRLHSSRAACSYGLDFNGYFNIITAEQVVFRSQICCYVVIGVPACPFRPLYLALLYANAFLLPLAVVA